MFLYLSILGIFLAVVLFYFNIRRYTSSIYLSIFCFLISLYSVDQYVMLYSGSVFWISIIFTNITFLGYLIGPMCFWYTRSVLTDNVRLKKGDLWHLLPMVIHLVASVHYILTPYSYKVEIAKMIVSNSGFLGTYKATFLSDLFSNESVYLSCPILLLFYIFWSAWLLIRFKTRKEEALVYSRQRFLNTWLLFFLGFQFLLVVSHLAILVASFKLNLSDALFTTNFLQGLSLIGLIGLIVTPFFFPQILYGLPNFNTSDYQLETKDEGNTLFLPESKKKPSNFEFQYMLVIIQKMATCMQEQQPYLQSDFNLSHFAVLIQVPTHHLAYFFREVKKQSFNDYRNECRVQYSKELIMAGKANELTLEAIGTLSGFTNRNTFFTAFKKVEGISPSAFVSQTNG